MARSTYNYIQSANPGGYRLTVDPGIVISGAGQLGQNAMYLSNSGTVDANVSGDRLTVDPQGGADGAVNTGTLRASGGGILRLSPGSFANTGGIIEAVGASSVVELHAASISGGSMQCSGGGRFTTAGNNTYSYLADLITPAQLEVVANTRLILRGAITHNGTLDLSSTTSTHYARLGIDGDTQVTGNGTITMAHSDYNLVESYGASTDRLTLGPDIELVGAGNLGAGAMYVTNNGTVDANIAGDTLRVQPYTGSNGAVNNGTFRASNGGTLYLYSGTIINNNALKTTGNSIVAVKTSITSTGQINVGPGSQLVFKDTSVRVLNQTAGSMIVNGTVNDDFTGGRLDIDGGTLGGTGQINVPVTIDGGTVAPGISIGQLSVGSSFTQNAGGTLEIELGGTTPGTEYDRLAVSGAAALGGTLQISYLNGFVPKAGQQFAILTCGSRTGGFASVLGPGQYSVVYNSGNVTLTVDAPCAVPADFDCDADVDGGDFRVFETCATGPAIPYNPAVLPEPAPGCTLTPDGSNHIAADFDKDSDVDQDDFGAFQRCYSGEGHPADPNCANG